MSFVAVSSLESPEHAMRKDPQIMTVIWNIGKRCNYDCSYCSMWVHDNYSPHLSFDDAKKFIDSLKDHVKKTKKKIKIGITGGEPFVNPNFLDIIQYISKIEDLVQLTVVTNGSLPYTIYEESSKYLTNFTVSLHFEQGKETLDKTVEKIIKLNKIDKWFLNVNVMATPGKFNELQEVVDKLKNHNVKYIVRKIDFSEDYISPNRKHNIDDEYYLDGRQSFRDHLDKNIKNNYYSESEIELLKQFSTTISWNNMRIYTPDNATETNSDVVKSNNQNQFKNWHCYIGIDTLNVQANGSVYRGVCMAGNRIGSLSTGIQFPEDPIICPLNNCICSADIITRKAKSQEYLHLINDNI